MNRVSKGVALALLALTLNACSSKPEEISKKATAEVLYSQARTSMELGNYSKAIRTLEALDSRYPFGPYKTQVQLDMIYSYYKTGDTAQALANIDRFIRLNPTSKDIDYVYFMRGLTNMQSDDYLFHDLLNIDRTDRDPQHAEQAFKDFDKLIKLHPTSKYAADARQRMKAIKNRLARYSIHVAEYYFKMSAWSAAASRAQYVLETFEGSPSREKALEIMAKAYKELGQKTLENHVLSVMKANYPNNSLLR
ncbi:outer membrane protein assembly factor BamD [Parashewanella curva]|uniref:Outer membrane protein assembly factor BamD n=1 Tax=Parashewanella curva TaxID=2338552 RepID=A0A3L8Q2D6_9GAMM|nr:outer membrane protein assembly factor BamD [Parashewanella curva]RLV61680.1 outer membrane protein assembly factor BamD [Parashewanella curva]